MPLPKLVALLLALSLAVAPSAFALSSPSTNDLLAMSLRDLMGMEVVSAASLLPTNRTQASGTVYRFGRADFSRLGVRTLDDLLRFVPGFQINQYRKRHTNLWARGNIDRNNSKLMLFVDGAPVRHVYYGHFSAGEQLPLEKIDHVEIILGPASSIYGANAFGGVIAVTTLAFSDEGETEASLEGGSNSRGKGTVSYRNDSLLLFGSYLSQNAPFGDDRKSFTGGEGDEPLAESYGDLYLKGRPAPGVTLTFDAQKSKTPYVFMAGGQDAFVEEQPMTASASYEAGDVKTGRIEARVWGTRDDIREYNTEWETGALSYEERQNATTYGGRIVGFLEAAPGHTVTVGASWDRTEAGNMDWTLNYHYKRGWLDTPEKGSLLRDPHTATDDYGLFLQDVWRIAENLTLTVGGRYDVYQDFDDFANYRLGLVWTPDDAQAIKLLHGTAHRTPTYREYQKVLEGTDFLPPTPAPEKMVTTELGYSYQWKESLISATLYRNQFSQPIRETPTPDDADEYFTNSRDEWRMSGVEVSLESRPVEGLSTQATLAWMEAVVEGGEALPYLARTTASFNIDYRWFRNASIGASMFYNSDRKDTNDYTADDPGSFVIVNLHGRGGISDRLDYAFGVDNIADTRVYDPAGDFGGQYNTEEARRTAWLRLTYSY